MLGGAFFTYHSMDSLISDTYFSIYQLILFTLNCDALLLCNALKLSYVNTPARGHAKSNIHNQTRA